MHTEIHVFDKPIERIKDACELLGIAGDFERKLPEVENTLRVWLQAAKPTSSG